MKYTKGILLIIAVTVVATSFFAFVKSAQLPTLSRKPVAIIRDTVTHPPTQKNITVPSVQGNSQQIASAILYKVPFTPQAPYANWDDQRQQDGCEEASALMAMRWVTGKRLSRKEALQEILAMSAFQQENYGHNHDTSAKDTVERIFKVYFKYNKVELRENIHVADIKEALVKGQLVLLPMNGQKLGNPYFHQPGPLKHMLVVIGYDPKTDEFITNDPGTKRGAGYRYAASIIEGAFRDYPSSSRGPLTTPANVMIVVSK